MSEQFPIFRLATLLARQLSSPIATRIKEYAKGHPRFGRSVCMRGGRAAAAVELRFKMWSLQLRPSSAPLAALTDARALDAGADLLGEMVLFSFGAAIIVYEVNRQAKQLEDKTAAESARRHTARRQVDQLRDLLRDQQHRLDALAASLRPLAHLPSSPPREPTTSPVLETPPVPKPSPGLGTIELCPCQPTTDPPL